VSCVREYKTDGGYNAAASEVRRRDTGIAVQLLHHAILIERCLYSAGRAVGKHRRYAFVDDVSRGLQRTAAVLLVTCCNVEKLFGHQGFVKWELTAVWCRD